MVMLRNVGAAVLLMAAGVLVGCDKKVKLTFTNMTDQGLSVELSGPGIATGQVGTVGPNAGKLHCELKIDKKLLPAECSWKAGDKGDKFTITKQTPKELWIDIEPTGPSVIRDKKTEIQKTRKVEVKDKVIHQDTVVE